MMKGVPELLEPDRATLAAWVVDARARTLALVDDLSDAQLEVPRLDILNPLRWELGHVAWFQELWALRTAHGRAPLLDVDRFYDSARVAHADRWHLPIPGRAETRAYATAVRDEVLAVLEREPTPRQAYLIALSVMHEDMHDEAFVYMRQMLGYAAPAGAVFAREAPLAAGDAELAACTMRVGSAPGRHFVFDNEKLPHDVDVGAFALARAPVTEAEYASFVEDRGYERQELWTEAGWSWRWRAAAAHPLHWRRAGDAWEVRTFDRWRPLDPRLPVVHVCAHEADAYCRWAGRRLPTEAEWEVAATGGAGTAARPYPWGASPPEPQRARLDAAAAGCAPVGALPEGDAPSGCRQMVGNVWEWTASAFAPYPGFSADPYAEYSAPWFGGSRRVLKGGCWATRGRLIRSAYRNFFTPDRRDVFAGFRTARGEAA